MANIAEVINSHHDKLNAHTAELHELDAKIEGVAKATDGELDVITAKLLAAEKRLDSVERRTKHLSTFADTIDGWLTKIKELV